MPGMDSLMDRPVETTWKTAVGATLVPPARVGPDGTARSPEAIIDELEQRCACLRGTDPECGADVRSAALGLLSGVEAFVDWLRFRAALTGRPLDLRFLPELKECERDLDAIETLWGRSHSSD